MTEEMFVQAQDENVDAEALAETDAGNPNKPEEEAVTADSDANWVLEIPLKDVTYKLSISPEQRIRLRSMIRPKPKPNGNEQEILADHKFSVENVWLLVANWINDQIDQHDSHKAEEGEDHHVIQPHHWPLDGYDCSDGFLPVTFFVESICDYVATVIGRAEAGRPLDWMPPTNGISAADVLTATVIALFEYYSLASITPSLKNSGVMP